MISARCAHGTSRSFVGIANQAADGARAGIDQPRGQPTADVPGRTGDEVTHPPMLPAAADRRYFTTRDRVSRGSTRVHPRDSPARGGSAPAGWSASTEDS